MATRTQNENTYEHWTDNADGTRTYWYELQRKYGWRARYVKIVDAQEKTIKFYQEIFNEHGELIELHEKYPVDTGHKRAGNTNL